MGGFLFIWPSNSFARGNKDYCILNAVLANEYSPKYIMNLFASTRGKKLSRPATKSDDEFLQITLCRKNTPTYFIYFDDENIKVEHIPTQKEVLKGFIPRPVPRSETN